MANFETRTTFFGYDQSPRKQNMPNEALNNPHHRDRWPTEPSDYLLPTFFCILFFSLKVLVRAERKRKEYLRSIGIGGIGETQANFYLQC